jgi:hypothetical protein
MNENDRCYRMIRNEQEQQRFVQEEEIRRKLTFEKCRAQFQQR